MTAATKKTNHFHEWFARLGGDLNLLSFDSLKIEKSINNIPLKHSSSLKNRPQEIKDKYNHKFKK